MTATEMVASHDASPELTRGFGFKIYKGEEQEELVSREQFAHPASVCYWSKTPAGTAAAGEAWRWERCPGFRNGPGVGGSEDLLPGD